jgi:peptidyl-prolyl cis-trans isomerase C
MVFTGLSVRRALGALAFAALLSAPPGLSSVSWAQDNDPVVARANGVDIRESDVAFAEEEIGGNIPAMPPLSYQLSG